MKKNVLVLLFIFMFGCDSSVLDKNTQEQNEVLCQTCKISDCEKELEICNSDKLCMRFDSCVNETHKSCDQCSLNSEIVNAADNWNVLNTCLCNKCSDFCTNSCENSCSF